MILLDTDHITVLQHADDRRYALLTARLSSSVDRDLATTIVSFEEQMRGWLAEIKRRREIRKQITVYDKLAMLIGFFNRWRMIRLDDRAVDSFHHLQKQRIRIGTQDLKIASIALAQDAFLLSANLVDFRQVPGLRVENWLD